MEPLNITTRAAGIADELRTIADQIKNLDLPKMFVTLQFQPSASVESDEVAAIDDIGLAVLGSRGKRVNMGSGAVHHHVSGNAGPISVAAFTSVTTDVQKLQARIAELEAQIEKQS